MAENQKPEYGYTEDLIKELNYKLNDLLAHVKLLSNSTNEWCEYKLGPEEINNISATIHDKTIAAIFVSQKLELSLKEPV